MKITIERELHPGQIKQTVVNVRHVGKDKVVILASVPGRPDIPQTLVATERMRGSSYAIAAHALQAVLGKLPAQRMTTTDEVPDD